MIGTSWTTWRSGFSSWTAAEPIRTRATTPPTSTPSSASDRGSEGCQRAKILERELEWARSNPKARQAKNRARLARYEELASEAERSRKLDLKRSTSRRVHGSAAMSSRYGSWSRDWGQTALQRPQLLAPAPVSSAWSGRTASANPRSRMIVGEDQPDSGDQLGETVRISYVDQGALGWTRGKRVGAGVRRTRSHQSRVSRCPRARTWHLSASRAGSAKACRSPLGRTKPSQSGADAEDGRQSAATRRAHE